MYWLRREPKATTARAPLAQPFGACDAVEPGPLPADRRRVREAKTAWGSASRCAAWGEGPPTENTTGSRVRYLRTRELVGFDAALFTFCRFLWVTPHVAVAFPIPHLRTRSRTMYVPGRISMVGQMNMLIGTMEQADEP